jgi:hypothetical protein
VFSWSDANPTFFGDIVLFINIFDLATGLLGANSSSILPKSISITPASQGLWKVGGAEVTVGSYTCVGETTNGKKLDNLKFACVLHFAYYNFLPPWTKLAFRNCGLRFRFHGHLYVSAGFKTHFFTVLIRQGVFDSDFSIEMISTFHSNLCLFGLGWVRRLENLLDDSRQGGTGFLGHNSTFRNKDYR